MARALGRQTGRALVDVVAGERAALEVQRRPLFLPYSDLTDSAAIPVADVREILASKWMMLDDRDEPRDLFDLWWDLTCGGIVFAEIAEAHRTRYGFAPMPASIERARKLGRMWEQRLEHQLANLPPFEEAVGVVERAFADWRDSQTSEMP